MSTSDTLTRRLHFADKVLSDTADRHGLPGIRHTHSGTDHTVQMSCCQMYQMDNDPRKSDSESRSALKAQ